MQNNKWVPQVLMDVEKYCRDNDLQDVALYLEDARRLFKLLQDEEISTAVRNSENVELIKLVWSQPEKQVEVSNALG